MSHSRPPHLPLFVTITSLALWAAPFVLRADGTDVAGDSAQPVRLEELEVRSPRASALSQAPTESRLDVLQPGSTINLNYISNNVAPTSDYANIANIAPSVSNVQTNGPGLSESKHLTLRGFDDNSYNVTFDGIPFGDINDFSHHTTSYFPAKLLGRVVVDRGPGTASTIGEATFGGTVALYSKDPRTEMTFVPTLNTGSWNTRLGHFEFNTGVQPALHGGSAIASYQRMTTDGFRTNSDMKRDTYYLKYLQPLGERSSLTLLSSYNKIHFSNPGTVTQQQIDTLGRNYGLVSDPAKTDFTGYNFQDKTADFEYLGFDSHLGGGWEISDKVYTFSYDNQSREKPKSKTVSGVVNFLGSYKVNTYRTYGNYLLLSHADATGTLKTGVWYDYSRNPRFLYGLNYTATGNKAVDLNTATAQFAPVAANPLTAVGAAYYDYSYDMVDWLKTWQPFAEYEWHATGDLVINPGVKYVHFTRDIDAPVNQTKARKPLVFSHTETKLLPYLASNYTVAPHWSAYAQVAEGLLAPNLNQFYVDAPDTNTAKPAQTWNYQIGTVYKTDRFNASADAYLIDFKNYAYKGPTNSSGDPAYYGVASGAYYRGVEFEATLSVGGGVSVYANGSVNKAEFKHSKLDVPTVPEGTAALGFVYDRDGFFSSLTGKYVGRWTVYDTLTNPDVAGGGATRKALSHDYWQGDWSIGYNEKLEHSFIHSFKVRFQVSNVFNKKVQVLDAVDASAANAYTKDAFNVLPGRSYYLTLTGEF